MHPVESGVVLPTVCGLIVLAAGLSVLVAGGAILVRLHPGWWRLLAIPAAYLMSEFVLVPVTIGVYATGSGWNAFRKLQHDPDESW